MEPPAQRNIAHARLASALSSGTDAAVPLAVNLPADTNESEPPPEVAQVEESPQTKLPYSYKDYIPEAIRVYTRSVDEVNDHLPLLRGPLGFDMEWKVLYSYGFGSRSRPTAVVQICDEIYIWVIQVSAMRKRFPSILKNILENPDVPKMGVNIRNDAEKLYTDFGIRMQNLVELSYMSRQADKTLRFGGKPNAKTLVSLQKLVGGYLDKDLLKDEARLSDWERWLTNKQLEYAANDAHCALQLYKKFLTMAEDDGVDLTPDWYTLRIGEDGKCVFKEDPPAPARTPRTARTARTARNTPKKDAAKAENTGASQVSEESVTPTEQTTEIENPKPAKRKASPRVRSSRPSKASAAPSSSDSSRSQASSWPPRRPSIRKRKKPEPPIVEITDSDISRRDESAGSEPQATSTQLSKANRSRQSPVRPRTVAVDHSSPPGEVSFSGRGWERFSYTGSTTPIAASSGKALSVRATEILAALEDD